jgi:hypothetical protein
MLTIPVIPIIPTIPMMTMTMSMTMMMMMIILMITIFCQKSILWVSQMCCGVTFLCRFARVDLLIFPGRRRLEEETRDVRQAARGNETSRKVGWFAGKAPQLNS